jgi:hypothetical protein
MAWSLRAPPKKRSLGRVVEGMFSIRKLGEPQDMLGIEISRNWDAGTITIQQAQKARALAASFGVEAESRALPMTPAVYVSNRGVSHAW